MKKLIEQAMSGQGDLPKGMTSNGAAFILRSRWMSMSKVIQDQMEQDIAAGRNVVIVDPKGKSMQWPRSLPKITNLI